MYIPAILSILLTSLLSTANGWALPSESDLLTREAYPEPDLFDDSFDLDLYARSYEDEYDFFPRAYNDDDLLADLIRRKGPQFQIPKDLKKIRGSMKKDEVGDTQALGEAVMEAAGIKTAELIAGWHGEGSSSKDQIEHFDIKPTNPEGDTIHVRWDGSWSQGKDGTVASGQVHVTLSKKNQAKLQSAATPAPAPAAAPATTTKTTGKKPKKARRGIEGIEARDIDAIDFYHARMIQARDAYQEALDAILGDY